jgi:para-nitrobenzyl esterase
MPDSDTKKRPVVFYIHGGGHFSGANSDTFFDGPHLIRDKEAIMVAPNYRLGALGYLYLKDYLGEEYADSGNCGLLDQICALKWVHDNIEAFGGDKDNVILMGQSAGGKSVANLMVTPAAKGLFRRAIIQSGATQCIRDMHTASKLASVMMKELGLKKANAEEILTMDGEKIIEAQKRAYKQINAGHLFGPVLDGRTILETPEEYVKNGKIGEFLGYYEILDTGAGIDTDGDGHGDSIINGQSIDVWQPSIQAARDWIKENGDYVYIKIIDGKG